MAKGNDIDLEAISMKNENVRKSELTREKQRLLWEGRQLYARGCFQKDILANLPEYQNARQDLEDYGIICNDIRCNLSEQYVDITYELSVLASIIRNTSMTIDFLEGK